MSRGFILLLFSLMPLLAVCQQDTGAARSYGKLNGNGTNDTRKAKNRQARVLATLDDAKGLYLQGKYGIAVKKFNQVLEWAKNNDSQEVAAQALEGLGLTYSAFQLLPESISTLRQALEINYRLSNLEGTARITELLSEVFYSNDNVDSSLHYANLSIQSASGMQMTYSLQAARLNKIAALIRLHLWKQADEAILRLPRTFLDDRHLNLLVRYYALLGSYHFAKGRLGHSRLYYDSALVVARTYNVSMLFAIVYGNMIDAYAEKGDYKSGFDCLQKYREDIKGMDSGNNQAKRPGSRTGFQPDLYKNNIYSLNIEKKLGKLQLLLEAADNKAKDVMLKHGEADRSDLEHKSLLKDSLLFLKDSLLQQAKRLTEAQQKELKSRKMLEGEKSLRHLHMLKDQEDTLKSLMMGLGAALVLGGVIYYQYKKQRRKNAIINKQNEELQTLMREIHHRVKNNLQVISSLLDLQSQTITDSQAAEAIKEGRNRVLSMALIHQNLYGDSNIKRIKVKEYIRSLSQGLMGSYHIEPSRIEIHTDIDDLDLDVDTVIPLGLILNELITNSLKHAFKQQPHGEIHIMLKEEANILVLTVKDNGRGFAEGAIAAHSSSFGMKLIKAFSIKLKAKLQMYNEDGAAVTMRIHKYKPA